MSLIDVWDGASGSPFYPAISKSAQFFIGFTLLFSALVLTVLFGLNPSLKTLPLLGAPASVAIGFGAVYMICAVGVYI